jgi:hypothetical protein
MNGRTERCTEAMRHLPADLPVIALRHSEAVWVLAEMGFQGGANRATFNEYIKSLRKEHPPDQVEQVLHRAFLARFGRSRQADGIYDSDRSAQARTHRPEQRRRLLQGRKLSRLQGATSRAGFAGLGGLVLLLVF